MDEKNLSLKDFLPSYPSVEPDLPPDLDPYEENFYEALLNKKEFFDLELERGEKRPLVQGDLYKHQQIVTRFLSSHTPYNSLMLFAYMGTGKTCSAFGTTELIRAQDADRVARGEKPIFRGVTVLARGKGLINNLMLELIFKCSAEGKYLPEDFETLTSLEKVRRIKKQLGVFYQFSTFYNFAKDVSKLNNEDIKRRYSNRVVVIDEVHNIRRAEEKDENVQVTYDSIHRFLHAITNGKILLLSGTPMRDGASEIAMVMNLILPSDQQLPLDQAFNEEFLIRKSLRGSEEKYLLVRKKKEDQLKGYFKGRVSYLSALSLLPKEYVGDYIIDNIPTFKLFVDIMSAPQSRAYNQAFQRDITQQGIRSNSRQASLMVFPNGTYGEEGFKTITKTITVTVIKKGKPEEVQKTTYDLSSIKKFLNQGAEGDLTKKLENLGKLSSKYAAAISQILDAEGRSAFVYCNLVVGGGAIVFSFLLKEFGFSAAQGNETSKRLRYGILTHKTTTTVQMGRIIERFNRPDNYQGEFIKVIIGSRVIGEGISLLNVQDIHILTPWWNYAEISQATARAIREGSHETLIQRGIQPQIRIYQHVSIPQVKIKGKEEYKPKYEKSIDLDMYKLSAFKDISIKSVERVMKEAAVDCGLTYKVNYNPDEADFSRECDYQKCQYTCDGLEDYVRKPDLSTYELYYGDSAVRELIQKLKGVFRTEFSLSIDEIEKRIKADRFTFFEVLTALRDLIDKAGEEGTAEGDSGALKNKYGFSSYLKENNNQYFLVNSLSSLPEKFSEYYVGRPYVRDPIEFSELLDQLQVKYLPLIIDALSASPADDERFRSLINRLPLDVKETLIEAGVLARREGITKNEKFREKILSHFSHYIQEINGVWISSLLYDEFEVLRCLKKSVWRDCEEGIEAQWTEKKEEARGDLETNPYGYYGIYDPDTDKFWIRDVREEAKVEAADRRTKTTGSECISTGWSREKLLNLIEDIQLEYPEEFCEGLSKDQVYEKAEKNTWVKRVINDDMSRESLCRALYYSTFKKGDLCPVIKDWFAEKGLLEVGKKEEKK